MKSHMNHNFAQIEGARVPRTSFQRDHKYGTTLDVNNLVPIFVDEALPGDTFKLNANIFARLATPLYPIMDNMFADMFFFAVPYRQVWDNFQKFMGEQIDPGDSTDYLIPQMTSPTSPTGYLIHSLHDYFGLPTGIPALTHSALFHRAYYAIWNAWFRDQNLQDSLDVPRDDGPDDPADYELQKRGKRADYFTTCLPWPQKGTAITMSLGESAPINVDDAEAATVGVFSTVEDEIRRLDSNGLNLKVDSLTNTTGMYADLANATAGTINALRLSIQLQTMLERDARSGTRYPEIMRSFFGVVSPDARLQRPEFLGGGSIPININPIHQSSESNTTDLGTLGGIGTVQGSAGFTKSFVEHNLIIGMVSIRADLTYQKGLDRMWSRLTKYDHYWPDLAHIGEQAVLNKEIYATGSIIPGSDDTIFGYQERWSEMRYKNSMLTGLMRSDAVGSLDYVHLSQDFATVPTLNSDFIEEDVPLDRAIAVPGQPQFIFDSYMKLTCVRPMPMFSTPGFGTRL